VGVKAVQCGACVTDRERPIKGGVRRMAPDLSPVDIATRFLVYEHAADAEHVAEGFAKAFAA